MKPVLLNPYREAGSSWIRGNLHVHSAEFSFHCAKVPLQEGVRRYHDEGGARFLAITDHDHVTDLSAVRAAFPDMVFLEGFEHSRAENMLFIGATVPPLNELPLAEAAARADGLLTMVCHPERIAGETHWTPAMVQAMRPCPLGVEIYNGHYGSPSMLARERNPLYTRFWDRLLTMGMRPWGFANDDFHYAEDFNNAFTMAQAESLSAPAILEALKNGRCYGSTGLLLEKIREINGRIRVATASSCTGRFVGPGGLVLCEAEGRVFEYAVTDEAYVRFEAEGPARRLFLQPMFCA